MATIDYLEGFPPRFRAQAEELCRSGVLLQRLQERYPEPHDINNNAALYTFTMDLKRTHMKSAPPIAKVRYSDKISTLHRAFGLHTYATRVQGNLTRTKNEIRIASLFKELSMPFLRMVVVHELAHLRHKDHDRAFYRLCNYMEPDYDQLERDLRLMLFARACTPAAE